jgi:hypothetical protein
VSAILSTCGTYRYRLERDVLKEGIVAALFGVNPSTADATANDATIRKDIGFAYLNGWRRIIKGNVFAYRATDVRMLASAANPVGPDNDAHLTQIMADADVLIPCWGSINKVPPRLRPEFKRLLTRLVACGKPVLTFGMTKDGDPKHPLMLAYRTPITPLANWLPRP